jgi:DNA-binding phage protein
VKRRDLIQHLVEHAGYLGALNEMKKTKTRPWDAAEHLETKEDQAAYLEAALEEGDPELLAAVLSDIERAVEMTETDRNTG